MKCSKQKLPEALVENLNRQAVYLKITSKDLIDLVDKKTADKK